MPESMCVPLVLIAILGAIASARKSGSGDAIVLFMFIFTVGPAIVWGIDSAIQQEFQPLESSHLVVGIMSLWGIFVGGWALRDKQNAVILGIFAYPFITPILAKAIDVWFFNDQTDVLQTYHIIFGWFAPVFALAAASLLAAGVRKVVQKKS